MYGIVIPPLISLLVNYFVIRKRLSRPVLSLLRHERKRGKVRNIRLDKFGFITRFRIRQMIQNTFLIACLFILIKIKRLFL